jgi:hypothetical protein
MAKVAQPGLGTRWPGQAIEHRLSKGSGAEEEKQGSRYSSALKEVTRGRARGGGQDTAMGDLAKSVMTSEWAEMVEVVATKLRGGVGLGLTLTAPQGPTSFIPPPHSTISQRGPGRPHGPPDKAAPTGVWPRPHALVGQPEKSRAQFPSWKPAHYCFCLF